MERNVEGAREDIYSKVTDAIGVALRKSKGAIIINVGGLDQERIMTSLSPNLAQFSTSSILSERASVVPREAKGIVVTSYSKDLDREAEERVQDFVGGAVANRSPTGRANGFPVVVLSKTLPKEQVFNDASLPWYNGPFEGDESVYSMKEKRGSKLGLTRHVLETERKGKRRVERWGVKEEFEY